MSTDLSEKEIIDFIIGDFEATWEALTVLSGAKSRGNFLFARQAMTLLEVACRLCNSDTTRSALDDLSAEIERRDKRYFTVLPGPCWAPNLRTRGAFKLPSRGLNPDSQLIAAIFNLVRNGQAHQYQQMRAVLADGKQFRFSLTGAEYGLSLDKVFAAGRPAQHLSASSDMNGDIWMTLRTDVLFLDLRDAVNNAKLLGRGLNLNFMSEDRIQTFNFNATDLENELRAGGHWT